MVVVVVVIMIKILIKIMTLTMIMTTIMIATVMMMKGGGEAGDGVLRAYLEQEDILSTVAAMNGELARPLLAGDDMQLRRKSCNGHHRFSCYVCPGHRQLQSLWSRTHSLTDRFVQTPAVYVCQLKYLW